MIRLLLVDRICTPQAASHVMHLISSLTPTPYTPFHYCYHYHTHRAQADLVQAALKQRGFEQTKCYFAMRYWHPFTEEVRGVLFGVLLMFLRWWCLLR